MTTNKIKEQGEDQLQSLLDTVERLRREKFPAVDPDLVREILRLHADGSLSDGEVGRAMEQAVERRVGKGA